MSRSRVRYTGMADSLFLSMQEIRRAIAQEEAAAAAAPTTNTDLQHQQLIQTRIDLESARPHLIDAIRRQRLSDTPDPALMSLLRALRDDIDNIIDGLHSQQMASRELTVVR